MTNKLYIDKDEMLQSIIDSNINNKWTDELTQMMIRLARGIAHHDFFLKFHDKESLIQDGILHLLQTWKSFDVNKSENPFGYFSRCLFRHYTKYIKDEHRHTSFKMRADMIIKNYIGLHDEQD